MNADWLALKAHLVSHTGLAYYHTREQQLLRAVGPCMEAAGHHTYKSYLAYLQNSPEEAERVVSRLTVGETYFFRDRPQFQALKDTVIPSLREQAAGRSPRVWSAGCSIGAEPYSLACLAHHKYGERPDPLSILATDINSEVLEVARRAEYSEWALRQVSPAERELYFTPIEKEQWRLRSHLRQNVTFQNHNLVSDPIPPMGQAFDMILCRNVLIYFDQTLIRRVLDQFYEALTPGGWLVVGYSEPNDDLFARFERVSRPGTILYRRPLIANALTTPPPPTVWSPSLVPRTVPYPRTEPSPPDALGLDELKSLADGGLWLQARVVADEILARDPLQSRAHFYRAMVQEQMGERQDAARSYRQAIYLDRSDPLPHYYWGLAQHASGALLEAARSFRTVVRLVDARVTASRDEDPDGVSWSLLRAQALNRLQEETVQ